MKSATANVKVRLWILCRGGLSFLGRALTRVWSVPEVFPLQMEGVRLVVNKGLSNHFQVSHTVTLSTLGESGYRFGSTYVGSKQTGPAEVPRMMLWISSSVDALTAPLTLT